jgi:hypothetical protein
MQPGSNLPSRQARSPRSLRRQPGAALGRYLGRHRGGASRSWEHNLPSRVAAMVARKGPDPKSMLVRFRIPGADRNKEIDRGGASRVPFSETSEAPSEFANSIPIGRRTLRSGCVRSTRRQRRSQLHRLFVRRSNIAAVWCLRTVFMSGSA